MTDQIMGYRAECETCGGLSYAEDVTFVDDWVAKHVMNNRGHNVVETTVRKYVGPIVHHDPV